MRAPALVLLAGLLAAAPGAAAQTAVPIRRVVVLPVRNFASPPAGLFSGARPVPAIEVPAAALIQQRLTDDPDLEVLSLDALRARVRALPISSGVPIALENKARGEQLYRDLNTEAAIPILEQAQASLDAAYYEVVEPDAMATLALTQALAYAEQKGDARIPDVHEVLKRMFWLDPGRRFARGFYADRFEGLITKAFTDFSATFAKENPFRGQARLEQFLKDVDIDTLVHAWVEDAGPGRGTVLRLMVYDRSLSTVSFSLKLDTEDPSTPARLERLDRFLSSWLTCLPKPVPETGPTEPEMRRFFIDTGFAYSIFTLNDATRESFQNLGVALYTEYQFLAGLGAFWRVVLFTSTRDPLLDLVDNVTSARVDLGLTYSFQSKWWRLAPHFGLEVQFLGTLQTTKEPWCKFKGLESKKCNETDGKESDLSGAITIGPTVGLTAQFFASRNFYIAVRANVSIYIAPFDDVDQLNIPFSAELSLGYAY